MARWPVLLLSIRYCGSFFDAWTVYPLNVIGVPIFLRMVPLTRPASEFQLTWSPILNPPRIPSDLPNVMHARPIVVGVAACTACVFVVGQCSISPQEASNARARSSESCSASRASSTPACASSALSETGELLTLVHDCRPLIQR